MLEVSGICKSYGKHRILNGVSFFSRARPVRGDRRNQWLRKDHASVDPGGSPAGRQREHPHQWDRDPGKVRGCRRPYGLCSPGEPADRRAVGKRQPAFMAPRKPEGDGEGSDRGLQLCPGDRPHAEEAGGYPCPRHESASASPAPFQAAPLSSLWTNRAALTWNVNGIYRPI